MERILKIDSIDDYNRLYGIETRNPLVTVADIDRTSLPMADGEVSYNYGVYALFLKQTYCGDMTYGRMPYDYQEGTVTSFAPGQVVHMKYRPNVKPRVLGLLFHPDLVRGTSLGQEIKQYSFFSYSSREALHLSEQEKAIFKDCLDKIKIEIERPIDGHSRKLICRNIEPHAAGLHPGPHNRPGQGAAPGHHEDGERNQLPARLPVFAALQPLLQAQHEHDAYGIQEAGKPIRQQRQPNRQPKQPNGNLKTTPTPT